MCFRISVQLSLSFLLCLAAESACLLCFFSFCSGRRWKPWRSGEPETGEVCSDAIAKSAGVGGGSASRYGETADGVSGNPAAGASGDGESRGSGKEIGDSRAWEACAKPVTWLEGRRCSECGQVLPESCEPPPDEPWTTWIF